MLMEWKLLSMIKLDFDCSEEIFYKNKYKYIWCLRRKEVNNTGIFCKSKGRGYVLP